MSTDFAFKGTFAFDSRASLDAFGAARPSLDDLVDGELHWIDAKLNAKKKTFDVEGIAEKSIFWSDVAPALEATCMEAAKRGAKGAIEIVDVGGAGFRWKIEAGEARRYDIAEDAAHELWSSATFARVRKRLEKNARDVAGTDVPARVISSPRNVAEARRALEHGQLDMVGEADGVTAARLLLDRDASADAVDRVLDAIARKWTRMHVPMMTGEDEPMLRSVLVHHTHARITARATERLRALEASPRDRATDRVVEGLVFLLHTRGQ